LATKQIKEIKNLTAAELAAKTRELEKELFQARMKKVTGQLEDTASLWRMRKNLARAKTLHTQMTKGK
jgi:large subunit ribosomal protein L29